MGPRSTVDNSTGAVWLLLDGKTIVPIWVKVGGEDPLGDIMYIQGFFNRK